MADSDPYDFRIPPKENSSSVHNEYSIPSNEEVVEDLTKDFENQIIDDETEKEETSGDEKIKCPIDDFIDEEGLKKELDTLNEEDKTSRKTEAEKLKQDGNEKFKNELFLEAIELYTSALRLCPPCYNNDRSILYSNRAAAKIKLNYNDSALDDLKMAIDLNPTYFKALLRRAKLFESMSKLDESLEDYKKLLEMDRSNSEVYHAVQSLTVKIEKRNEEMKEEMIGKFSEMQE